MKLVKQISIFIENKSGKMADALLAIADRGININALSIADTADFGILRLIVNEPDKAYEAIKELGMAVKLTDVAAVAIDSGVGGLAKVIAPLKGTGIDIEYMYAFNGKFHNGSVVILRVNDNEKFLQVAKEKGLTLLSEEEAYSTI